MILNDEMFHFCTSFKNFNCYKPAQSFPLFLPYWQDSSAATCPQIVFILKILCGAGGNAKEGGIEDVGK